MFYDQMLNADKVAGTCCIQYKRKSSFATVVKFFKIGFCYSVSSLHC